MSDKYPDFIDPNVLVDSSIKGGLWPETSIMPERAFKLILEGGISYYQKYPNALQRAMPFLETVELADVKALLTEKPLSVVHGFARRTKSFPVCAIVLMGDKEAGQERFLGDYTTVGENQYKDSDTDIAEIHTVSFDPVYHFMIYAQHPDLCSYYYYLVRHILMQSRRVLAYLGVDIPRYGGLDMRPDDNYLPEYIYIRTFTAQVRVRQSWVEDQKMISSVNAYVRSALGYIDTFTR